MLGFVGWGRGCEVAVLGGWEVGYRRGPGL